MLRALIAETTTSHHRSIRGRTLIDDSIPLLQPMTNVADCPELPATAAHLLSKQLRRCIAMHPFLHFGPLFRSQTSAVAASPSILQGRNALRTVLSPPTQQAAIAAPSDLANLVRTVAYTVQPHRLVANSSFCILALGVRLL